MSLHFLRRQVQGVWKGTVVPEGTQESAGVHRLGLGASSLLQPGPSSVPEDWEIIGVTALRAPRAPMDTAECLSAAGGVRPSPR